MPVAWTMIGPEGGHNDERVLVVAPTARDGSVTRTLLEKVGVHCESCAGLVDAARKIGEGVGALILTDSALFDPAIATLLAAVDGQSRWSDIPILILTRDREYTGAAAAFMGRLSNLTVLDRPVSARSMVSAVQAALRGRMRQYQLRDQMQAQDAAEQALREADRRKDEFLATLAHELRNPLAPLRNAMHLLGSARLDEKQTAHLREMMERQLAQLIKLIDDLLDVSRIATGKVNLQLSRIDLRLVLERAVESSQPAIRAASHVLDLRLPHTPVWVLGDASRLEQVACNLINNACKYSPPSGHIQVALTDEDGRAVTRVADHGVGIPAAMLGSIFELFTQIDRNLDRAQGGLGVGLSLVRRLIDLHGGQVHAESAGLNQGSTFVVSMPLLSQDIAESTPATVRASHVPRRKRVLIVDDNVDAADSLSMLLEAEGHSTRTAYGGAAALSAAREFQPEAVFCDLGMPGVDGYMVASSLRSDQRYTPTVLVAVSGWGTAQDKLRTREEGFDFHVTKPIALDDVNRILAGL